jgi:PTH2 family peptidyl-tRNA hydrolase
MNTKQVIVMRKDLNMRKGKMIAQGSHASMSFLTKNGSVCRDWRDEDWCVIEFCSSTYEIEKYEEEINHWLQNSFRKITVYVNSQEELEAVHQAALNAGLISHLVTDNGATEFNGVPTMTCCAIGPHWDSKFEGITDHLLLL